MKKIVAILAVLTTVASVQADIQSRDWSSQTVIVDISGYPAFLTAPEAQGDGAEWVYEVWDFTDNVIIQGSKPANEVTGGWYSGYVLGAFNFSSLEAHEVALQFFNVLAKPTDSTKYWRLRSNSLTLADLDDDNPPSPTDLEVTFDFAGQTWQQVPEPATFSLIGLVGLGMIVARRRALRKASIL